MGPRPTGPERNGASDMILLFIVSVIGLTHIIVDSEIMSARKKVGTLTRPRA